MDSNDYEDNLPESTPGKTYFAVFAIFIAASASLAAWAFVLLALAK